MLKVKDLFLNLITLSMFWLSLLAALVIIFSAIAPNSDAMLTIKYILFALPRYWFIFICMLLAMLWSRLTTLKKYSLPLIFAVSVYYLDFQMNINTDTKNTTNLPSFTLVTANLGEGVELSRLASLIKYYNPDAFVFQEATNLKNFKVFDGYPFKDCRGNLCFISKHKFKKVNFLGNSLFVGYGDLAAFYELNINNSNVNLANVHFPTVRRAFSDPSSLDVVHANRVISASLLSEWAEIKTNAIIAGDFNMTVTDNLYRRNFNKFQNVITDFGFGFNNTFDFNYRGLSVPGVRIDHILLSKSFNIEQATTLDNLGGDHRPVLSKFTLNISK
ncbi:MAG: endonuclease/exonuclease/phosphatase (EEP) superfamily protein YafD [Cognaticolwellia sp.]|jgi:endonuclease/exonuclease/phosphatase (EEP) superfamily protein YafD